MYSYIATAIYHYNYSIALYIEMCIYDYTIYLLKQSAVQNKISGARSSFGKFGEKNRYSGPSLNKPSELRTQ